MQALVGQAFSLPDFCHRLLVLLCYKQNIWV